MRYFKPDLRLSAELPPQNQPEDKLGGLPWGLPQDRWPLCEHCARPLALLAQFAHHPVRLDLGRAGRVLHVFYCNSEDVCPSWEGGGGANACLVTEPEELGTGLTALPDEDARLETEARIVGWIERDDGISAADAPHFLTEAFDDLPDALLKQPDPETKLGGVPSWVQYPETPGEGWRFAAQLSNYYKFLSRPTARVEGISESQREEGTYFCDGPNFGDAGSAYIFLRDGAGGPEGWLCWQCG
jgi:hypothetical protein